MNNLFFKSTDSTYIRIENIDVSIDQISFMNTFNIYWHENNYERFIGVTWSSEFLDNMISTLSRALNNQLIFNFENCSSPAILDNEFIIPEELRPVIEENARKQGRISYICASKYLICTTRDRVNPKLATWIYNDEHQNIVLEVGEQFIWPDLPDDEKLQPTDPIVFDFFKFIQSYKPTIKTIIPRTIAAAWLTQVQKLVEIMNYNEVAQCPDCMENKHRDTDDSPTVHKRELKK